MTKFYHYKHPKYTSLRRSRRAGWVIPVVVLLYVLAVGLSVYVLVLQ